jgi:hypothetical protein
MTTLQLREELFREINPILDNEGLLLRLLKYVRKLTATNADETLVDKKEFMESLDRGEEEYRQGKCVRLLQGESVAEMLRRSGL